MTADCLFLFRVWMGKFVKIRHPPLRSPCPLMFSEPQPYREEEASESALKTCIWVSQTSD